MPFVFEYELKGENFLSEWETEISEIEYALLEKGILKGKELNQIKGLEDMIASVISEIEHETGGKVKNLVIGEVMYDELFLDDEIE